MYATVEAITFGFADASRSIIFAWMSRGHGQRPRLPRLWSSIAITAMSPEGVRDETCTPMS